MYTRKTLSLGFVTVAASFALATLASAQAPAPAPFMVHQLKPDVYWVEGGGGNSGVIVGDKGVIVIDAKTTPAGGKELLDNIAKITPKPVTAVILTLDADQFVPGHGMCS
jgi:alkyl sulfatase BDS1-like metallo-beta-lactamase superfamily hydrolase